MFAARTNKLLLRPRYLRFRSVGYLRFRPIVPRQMLCVVSSDYGKPNNYYDQLQNLIHLSKREFGLWSAFKTAIEWVSTTVSTAAKCVWKAAKSVGDYAFSSVSTDKPPTHSRQATQESQRVNNSQDEDRQPSYPDPPFKGWSTKNINIAVIGDSGNGKSSFINAYLNKDLDDPNRAKTGFVETTGVGINQNVNYYEYEVNSSRKVLFWDLPGCGTSRYPFDEYIQRMGLRHFDFCLIITSTRFTEHDDKLAHQLQTFQVPVPTYLIRSKFDQDLVNHCRDNNIDYEALEETKQTEMVEYVRNTLQDNIRLTLPRSGDFFVDRYFILSSSCMALTIDDWKRLQHELIFELASHRNADSSLKKSLKKKWIDVESIWAKGKQMFDKGMDKVRSMKQTKSTTEKYDLKNWLTETVGLPQYYVRFVENGIEDMGDVLYITSDHLSTMEITRLGHRTRILKEVEKFKFPPPQ